MHLVEGKTHKLDNAILDSLISADGLSILSSTSIFICDIDYFSFDSASSYYTFDHKVIFADTHATPRLEAQYLSESTINDDNTRLPN